MKNGNFSIAVLIFSLVIFAITLLFWPLNAMLRTHYGYRAELTSRYRQLGTLLRLVCFLNLVFAGCYAAWLSSVNDNIALLSSHFDGRLHLLQIVGVLGVIGALVAIAYCWRSWGNASLWFWTKLWNTLLMLACVGYAWFLLNWHMLNFRLNY